MADDTPSSKRLLETGKFAEDSADQLQAQSVNSGYGPMTSAVSAAFSGHNHRGMGNPAPVNNELYGMVFFTRPRLNLSYDNISRDRSFTPMLTEKRATVARAIRSILDPKAEGHGYVGQNTADKQKNRGTNAGLIDSPLTDPNNAFISIASNCLESMSGWPDPYVDTYTSRSGVYGDEWSMVDSYAKYYKSFDLSCNFRNIVGDPIGYLFHVWTQYASLVREGTFDPHPEMILENEVDYNTRIYRIVLDPSKTYVTRIAACGAAFPTTNSIGSMFNFAADKPYNRDADQISVTFKCMGAIYYDPILFQSFNRTVTMFNNAMRDSEAGTTADDIYADAVRKQHFTKLSPTERPLFNYQGYPHINPFTTELEWWVPKEDYDTVLGNLKQHVG